MNSRRVLVTGAAGLVGGAAIHQFVESGWEVVATDVGGRTARTGGSMVTWSDLDVTTVNPDALEGIDTVVHLGALTLSAEGSVSAQTMLDVNVVGTERLFRCAVSAGVRRVVYASSAAVYGGLGPLTDYVAGAGPFIPSSLYGHTKLMCEGLAKHHADCSDVTFVGMRPTFSYGLGRLSGISGVFAQWIIDAIQGRPAVLPPPFGESGRLQLMHVDDLAASLVSCADLELDAAVGGRSRRSIVLNSPTRELLSVRELVTTLQEVTDNPAVSVQQLDFDEEMVLPLMDTETAAELLGFEQALPFREAARHIQCELAVQS